MIVTCKYIYVPPSVVASADVDMHCPPRILWSTSRSQGPTGVIGLIHLGSMTIYINMTHALVCILPYFRIYRYIERGRKQNLQNEICFPHQKEFKCELVFSWHHVILNIYMPLKKEAFSRNHSAMRRCLPVKAIFFLRSSWAGYPSVASDIEYATYFTAILEGTKSNPFDILSKSGLLCLGAFQTLKPRNLHHI